MAETLQIILLIMVVVVIVFVIVLGVQVFYLIKDVRKTISKANRVLGNTNSITDSISEPLSAISGIVGTVSAGSVLTKILKVAIKVMAKSDDRKSRKDTE